MAPTPAWMHQEKNLQIRDAIGSKGLCDCLSDSHVCDDPRAGDGTSLPFLLEGKLTSSLYVLVIAHFQKSLVWRFNFVVASFLASVDNGCLIFKTNWAVNPNQLLA